VLGIEMKHLKNNKKKNNEIVITTTTLFTIATILVFATIVIPSSQQLAYARLPVFSAGREVPPAITGDNIYIAWWTNNTENGNEEVMFRASNDGGATFGDKMNLSNTPDADSGRVEIAGEGDTVIVSWWETNQTSDIPVARISTDAGETFGPMLRLAANGTISSTEVGETTEEEAVGGAEVAE
jgi:hypothetical protein